MKKNKSASHLPDSQVVVAITTLPNRGSQKVRPGPIAASGDTLELQILKSCPRAIVRNSRGLVSFDSVAHASLSTNGLYSLPDSSFPHPSDSDYCSTESWVTLDSDAPNCLEQAFCDNVRADQSYITGI